MAFGPHPAVFRAEPGVVSLELQHRGNPGDVQTIPEELTDPLEQEEVILAVAAGAALGALRFEQPALFIQP